MIRSIIRKSVEIIFGSKTTHDYITAYYKLKRLTHSSAVKILFNGRPATPYYNLPEEGSYSRQAAKIFKSPIINKGDFYIHPINKWRLRIVPNGVSSLASMTVDFAVVLDSDFECLKTRLEKLPSSDFKTAELSIINTVHKYAKAIAKKLRSSHSERHKALYQYFNVMPDGRPQSLDAALQKILFFDALFWQMGHQHIGLGRLDKILFPYYKRDIDAGVLDYDRAKELIYQFCLSLHRDFHAKSAGLLGDTGQYILLGGVDDDGATVDNAITHIFLEVLKNNPLPDPKLILRVNSQTSTEVWRHAIDCVLTGSGSPLLLNEERVMANMVAFGYNLSDVAQLGTSACWEPLIINKSFDQNNPFKSGNALRAVHEALHNASVTDSFEDIYVSFIKRLGTYLRDAIPSQKHFDVSPLFSLFYDDCIAREKDFSRGGARYAYHGAQIVGLPNAVNALLNIRQYVFDSKLMSLHRLKDALDNNFDGSTDIRMLFLANPLKFGNPDETVVKLTQRIMNDVSDIIRTLSCNGQPLKVGFSSPNYVYGGRDLPATADGRKANEPLAVHISPVSSEIDLASILDFASALDYGDNRLNGNVVDFIIPPSFARQPDKLINLLKAACEKGLFEIQLNVLDYATLVDAKLHPEKHSNLIVRVWGFSAYFNELPEEYQDNLIARAKAYA